MKTIRLSTYIPEPAYKALKQNYKQLGYTTLNSYIVQSAINNLQNNISTSNSFIASSGSDFSLKEASHEKEANHNHR